MLKQLFEQYYQEIYRYFYGLCYNPHVAEDLTSEVFVEVIKSIRNFRGDSDVKTWMFSIARHKWYAYLRKQYQRPEIESDTHFSCETIVNQLELQIVQKDLLNQINMWLLEEPEKTQNIFRKRLEGYSYYEIAKEYGISENSARVIDFRMKVKIRERLKKEGYTYDEIKL